MKDCKHKKIKKNYPFGKNSNPIMYCKLCNKEISRKELRELKPKKT